MSAITPKRLVERCFDLDDRRLTDEAAKFTAIVHEHLKKSSVGGDDIRDLIEADERLPNWFRTQADKLLRARTLTETLELARYEVQASYIGRVFRSAIIEAESPEDAETIMLAAPSSAGESVGNETCYDLGPTGENVFDENEPDLETNASLVESEEPETEAERYTRNLVNAYCAIAANIIWRAETEEADGEGRFRTTTLEEFNEGAIGNMAQMLTEKEHIRSHEIIHRLVEAQISGEKLTKIALLIPAAKDALAVLSGEKVAGGIKV